MANPIIKIKRVNQDAYANTPEITPSEDFSVLNPLSEGELAYNAYDNGLYIGYDGKNKLLSVTNGNYKGEPQNFYGIASKANQWTTSRIINGMSINGAANRTNYGTCSTGASTQTKTVSCTGFSLITGSEITVKFTVTNTADNPNLNVNNTGAKPIYYRGSAINKGYLASGRTYTFRYNGTQYELVGDVNTNTTYSVFVKSGSGAKSGLVPAPSTTAGTTKYLREDGTWTVPPDTTYTFNGAISTIKDNNLTASRALISDTNGKVAVSAITSTELEYLDGVTENLKTSLDKKLNLTGGTMTGTLIIGQGDGNGIQLGTLGFINATTDTSTNCTLLGATVIDNTSVSLVGHPSFKLTMRGSETNPTYNGEQIVLASNLSSYLPLSGGTVTGTLTLSKTQDLSGTANNSPALIVGGTATTSHLEVDANEVQAKTNGTSVNTLYLNGDGGQVIVGSGGLKVANISTDSGTAFTLTSGSTIYMDRGASTSHIFKMNGTENARFNPSGHFVPGTNNTYNIGASNNVWKNIYATTFTGALSGNATTATTLQTARTINGTSFNGSANITTANWGTARTITIGDTGKSVNGSSNVSWSVDEIGAMPSVKTKSITVTGDANTYYPVVIETTASKTYPNYISVWKNLGSTTNSSYSGNHSNGTSSMWIMYELRNQLWDGNGGYCKTLYYNMNYATLCSRAQMLGSAVGHLCLWLRGGTTSYEISCIGTSEPTVSVYYSNVNLGSSTYPVNVGPETTIGNKGKCSNAPLGYGDVIGNSYSASCVLDKSNNTETYLNYSASGLSTTSWFAAWNGYELRAISPANTLSVIKALPLAGGTMTGQIVMDSTGWKTNNAAGYVVDQYGNFTHLTTTTTNNFNIFSNNQTKYLKVWFETGNVETTGSITSTGAISTSNRLISNSISNTTNPTQQSLVLNGVTGSSDTALAPGIGFHIGNLNYATLKFLSDGSFRFYNNGCTAYHPVYVSNLNASGRISVTSLGGSWISGMTVSNASLAISTQNSSGSYHPIIAGKTYGGHFWNLGTYINEVGFYGYYNGRTANSYDWKTKWDVNTGQMYSSGQINAAGGLVSGSYFSVDPSTNDGGLAYKGRADIDCIRLTNTNWTGYGTSDPESAGYDKVTGRVYFKLI